MKVKSESEVAQSCPTLSDPTDCSLPGSSVHGIFQAKVLEWDAIAFSEIVWQFLKKLQIELLRQSVQSLSCVRLLATPCTAAHQAPPSMEFSTQEYWNGLPLPYPINNLTLYLKQLEEEQTKLEVSIRKEIIKIRAEIHEIQGKKTKAKVKLKVGSLRR